VLLRASGGTELGVATDYGVLFLGRSATSGMVDMTAWFSDGPSWEEGSVLPCGGGLYATEAEIRLTTVPLSFTVPDPGTDVLVRGRRGAEVWETETVVVTHPQVEGLLLRPNDRLRDLGDEEVGAGVYVGPPDARRLIGLVSGSLLFETADGRREFVTVLGPNDLWRVALLRKSGPKPPHRAYRDDIL